MYSVSITSMIKEFDLKLLTEKIDVSERLITRPEINRPALQLAGFYDYFDSNRVQIIGKVEHTFLGQMDLEQRRETLHKLFMHEIPCFVLCRELEPYPEMLEFADLYGIPIFRSEYTTTNFMGEIIRWLRMQLAPRVTLHGVLVDVFGEGVLIMGESGIGKSETALELIKRGHRLVSDDAVEIKKVSKSTLVGSCPELIRFFIELRGIGIIDVKQMYGVECIKATQVIDLVIRLEIWEKDKEVDRMGLEEEYMDILGSPVVCHTIPIKPGRNIAVICECAALNHRQKKMGYNAAKVLQEKIMEKVRA